MKTLGLLIHPLDRSYGLPYVSNIIKNHPWLRVFIGKWFIRWALNKYSISIKHVILFCFVFKVFGTTELSEKPIMLPAFVDATHCLPYHLTRTGRAVADRIVNVLGYDCPDITYSPVLYPITSILLHFMSGKYLELSFKILLLNSQTTLL